MKFWKNIQTSSNGIPISAPCISVLIFYTNLFPAVKIRTTKSFTENILKYYYIYNIYYYIYLSLFPPNRSNFFFDKRFFKLLSSYTKASREHRVFMVLKAKINKTCLSVLTKVRLTSEAHFSYLLPILLATLFVFFKYQSEIS